MAASELGIADALANIKIVVFLTCGFLVFFMQIGFVALETGGGRAKNVKNVLLKNLIDAMVCGLVWWCCGYAFAYGSSANGFIGHSMFFYNGSEASDKPWFFSWAVALCCITVISGCLAERTRLSAYPLYTILITGFVQPVCLHWVWDQYGWLATFSDCHFLDAAGGSVVHVLAGVTGVIAAAFCGPRLGRFEDGASKEMPGHDITWVGIGTLMLWFGWYGFNCGAVWLHMDSGAVPMRRVAVNTTLSAASSGLTTLLIHHFLSAGTFDLQVCCNGLLSGLVAITGSCAFLDTWAAVLSGLLAGGIYVGSSHLLVRLRVDDPLDASAVHLGNGALGCLFNGLFAKPEIVSQMSLGICGGVIYSSEGWLQLGVQVLGLLVIAAWTSFFAVLLFGALRHWRVLRVDQATELAGIDNMDHGGPAYPEFNLVAMNGVHAGI